MAKQPQLDKNGFRKFGMLDKVSYAAGDFGCNMSFALAGTYFTLFWTQWDFDNSTNAGWLELENGNALVRLGGSVREYNAADASCGLYEDLRQLILAVRKDYAYLLK